MLVVCERSTDGLIKTSDVGAGRIPRVGNCHPLKISDLGMMIGSGRGTAMQCYRL